MKKLQKFPGIWFLIGICSVFILLRIPSLIEPHWYGDEGIYQVIGRGIIDGKILYKEIWDNKPPFLYIIYAAAGGDLFTVKVMSLLTGLISVIVFFLLSKKLFTKRSSIYVSTIIYALLFGLPILEGNIANAENFMLLPVVFAAYLIYSYSRNEIRNYLIFSGLFLAIAFTIKIVSVFDFAAFLLFLILIKFKSKKSLIHLSKLFVLPFVSLMAFFALYFISVGAFKDFLNGVFLQNISYVSEQYGADNPQILLVVRTIILFILTGFIIFLRRKFKNATLFILIWIMFALYSAFFSYRPYIHYLLVLLPPFALLFGHILETNRFRLINLLLISFIAITAFYQITIYRKNIAYYQNFIQFILGKKSITAYQKFFDSNTPRDYNIANFINTNVDHDEKVFLWSDSAQIYALTNKQPIGKYIVAYHITYYKNADRAIKNDIDKFKPKFIVQTSLEPLIKEFLYSYKLRYIMEGTKIYEREI